MGLVGTLSAAAPLVGKLAAGKSLTGSLQVMSTLTGALSTEDTLVGTLTSDYISLTGKLTIPYRDDESTIETYTGIYTVTPQPFTTQTLETANKKMARNVTIKEIPYFQTSNLTGDTIYIGG